MGQKPYDRRNWLKQLFSLEGSVLPLVAPKVFLITLVAAGLTWLEHTTKLPQLPMTPFTVLGTALGLLLTFRTNASYERFWEARKAWGTMVNRCRNSARLAAVYLPDETLRSDFIRYLCGYVHATKRKLWKEKTVPELSRIFSGDTASQLCEPPGAAQRCLLEMGKIIRTARNQNSFSTSVHLRFEEDLALLIDQLGICERIQNTPIPIGYALHLRRFMIIYCLALTLAFVDPFGWYAPIVVAFISYAFLGIERIAIEIEDPFEHTVNDLNLEQISLTVERDVSAYPPAPLPG